MKHFSLLGLVCVLGCHTSYVQHGIPNFAQVSSGVYRGGEPNANGWVYLQSIGVSNSVMLDVVGESNGIDANNTNGMAALRSMWTFYRPISTEQQLGVVEVNSNNVMEAVSDLDFLPGVFVHCLHGQDRTGLIVAIYRIKHGWTKPDAEKEMLAHGFHKELLGLWHYWNEFKN